MNQPYLRLCHFSKAHSVTGIFIFITIIIFVITGICYILPSYFFFSFHVPCSPEEYKLQVLFPLIDKIETTAFPILPHP